MRLILLLVCTLSLVLLTSRSDGHTLGDLFTDEIAGSHAKYTKITKDPNSEREVYRLEQSNFPEIYTSIAVSKKTGRIIEYLSGGGFASMHEAVLMAASLCEGEVSMPTQATPSGFILACKPGGKYEGTSFYITINSFRGVWELKASCLDFEFPHLIPEGFDDADKNIQERLQRLRERRDSYEAQGKK